MKTIKIIDLLNKIANGEEVPKKIKYKNKIWCYKEGIKEYISNDTFYTLNFELDELNDKVEILEKKIPEKMGLFEIQKQELSEIDENTELILDYKKVSKEFNNIHKKYDEIIDYLDYLEAKGE